VISFLEQEKRGLVQGPRDMRQGVRVSLAAPKFNITYFLKAHS